MNSKKVTIIDYGMGNLFSIEGAIRSVGGDIEITDDPAKILNAERLILPGVGAFGKGMEELKKRSIIDAIYSFIETGRTLLGICLGMQLCLSVSNEFGLHKGLDIVKGKVMRFTDTPGPKGRFKIPQIGWNSISPVQPGNSWDGTLLAGINPGSNFYFVHSYVCVPDDNKHVLAQSEYGEDKFCSVLHKENIWGCQFHPERSAGDGLRVYKNFLNLKI